MPAAAVMAGIGAAGSVASGIGSLATSASRKKYAEYVSPDMGNYQFGTDTYDQSGARRFYEEGEAAKNRQLDPYAMEQQKKLVGQLQAMAEGKGPSAAQATLQAGTDRSISSAMSLAASGRGSNLGGAQLGAIQAGTQAAQQGANQGAILAAQEQQAAIGQLGGQLGAMRGATLNEAQYRSQLEQYYTSMGASREEAALKAKMMYEQEAGQRRGQYQQLAAKEEEGKIAGMQKAWAGIGQGFSQLGSMGGSMGGKGGAPSGGGG